MDGLYFKKIGINWTRRQHWYWIRMCSARHCFTNCVRCPTDRYVTKTHLQFWRFLPCLCKTSTWCQRSWFVNKCYRMNLWYNLQPSLCVWSIPPLRTLSWTIRMKFCVFLSASHALALLHICFYVQDTSVFSRTLLSLFVNLAI